MRRRARLERLERAHLYAVTPESPPAELEALVEAWLEGGVDLVQLRAKHLPRAQLPDLASRLAARCSGRALLIIDDYLDVALLSEADGVHLGADDLSVAAARRVCGDLLVGASASDPAAAREAVAQGADYIGCGPAFATPIKAAKPPIGPEGVARVARAVSVPVFAIGGIDRSRLPELAAAGVRRVCAIRGLGAVADPAAEVRVWRAALAA
jgi:thiamine-phosphate pyrophosphorylase